jgi:pimeloyl-ACP methyl ester carboxylesterase
MRGFRWLCAALALCAVCVLGGGTVPAVTAKHRKATAHSEIYLFRGFFSMPGSRSGMGELAALLRKQGISATVRSSSDWRELAREAAAKYKRGRLHSIVLVGYSAGASTVADMASRLAELGAPVKLAIVLDPVWPTFASGRVDRFVNYYDRGMRIGRSKQFKGRLQNVGLHIAGVDHGSMDINKIIQQRVMHDIHAALDDTAVKQLPLSASARACHDCAAAR